MIKTSFACFLTLLLAFAAVHAPPAAAGRFENARRSCEDALARATAAASAFHERVNAAAYAFGYALGEKAGRLHEAFVERFDRAARDYENLHRDWQRSVYEAQAEQMRFAAAMDRKVGYVLGLIARTFSTSRQRAVFNARAIASQAAHRNYKHQALDENDVERMVRRTVARFPDSKTLWAYELPAPLALFVENRFWPRIYRAGTVVVLNDDLIVAATPMLDLKASVVYSNARDLVPVR